MPGFWLDLMAGGHCFFFINHGTTSSKSVFVEKNINWSIDIPWPAFKCWAVCSLVWVPVYTRSLHDLYHLQKLIKSTTVVQAIVSFKSVKFNPKHPPGHLMPFPLQVIKGLFLLSFKWLKWKRLHCNLKKVNHHFQVLLSYFKKV